MLANTYLHYALDVWFEEAVKAHCQGAAYRAETAMANLLRETMSHPDEARSLLRALYQSDADLLPDHKEGILTVRLHHMANRCSDAASPMQ